MNIHISYSSETTKKEDNICAKFDNHKVFLSDVLSNMKLSKKDFNELPSETKKQLISNHVTSVLIEKELKASKIIEKGGKYFKEYEIKVSNAKSEIFINSKLEGSITEDEIYDKYAKFVKEVKEKGKLKLKYVIFASEQEAIQFSESTKNAKGNFDEIVKKCISEGKTNAGSIVLTPGMWPHKENLLFNMKPGNISDAFEFQEGIFMVVKIISKEKVEQIPTYEQKKEEIRNFIVMKKANEIVCDLHKKYNVKITL